MGRTVHGTAADASDNDARTGRDDLAGDFAGQTWPDDRVWFARLVRRCWPIKATMAIAQYCGCPERTARNYASAHSEPPASILRDLLCGAEGHAVAVAMFRDSPPAWWCEQVRNADIGKRVTAIVKPT